MTVTELQFPASQPDPDSELAEFGLSIELLHEVARPGLGSALNRTRVANAGAQSNDIYQDTSEHLRLRLARQGWDTRDVYQQRRVIHPEGRMAIVVASAVNVGVVGDPARMPLTRPKGPATFSSLGRQRLANDGVLALPEFQAAAIPPEGAPLWMLLHELTDSQLLMELSEARGYRDDGCVDTWGRRIVLPPLAAGGVDSSFDDGDSDDFDIPVSPR